jgi:NADH-quinone oxidoreductase subunit I
MAKIIQRPVLTFWEKTYIPQILNGLSITFRNMFKKKVTLEYPEARPEIPLGYRGMPTLVKDPHGREKCVSCQLCEFVCPPKAITILPGFIPSDAPNANVEKAPKEFDIDMLRCIYCGLCQEVCPEEAIFLQEKFSLNGLSRKELVFGKEKLYELGGTRTDAHLKWERKKEAERNGSGH